jgi:ferritin-like metal-binding protein YciE
MSEDEIWREYERATQKAYEALVTACAPHREEAHRQIEAIWQVYKTHSDPLIAMYRTATAPERAEMQGKLATIY